MSNGKGSKPRGQEPDSRKRYAAGWARIFGKKPQKSVAPNRYGSKLKPHH